MKLADVPKFDPTLFSEDELVDLEGLVALCQNADTVETIEEAGAILDEARFANRTMVRELAARSYSLNALYKRLIGFVPRPLIHEEAEE